ncbi:PREDICTED: forkhead-associated domain-containing protein 1 [Apaloderma vittatum]|uniref:forkhead-associated domain-containing protein 1 n=1 Tax=Apaloderma vittatum TaxID=57397 RepID=UPI0005212721|nr:PREDICTED: forkhead-associated domain-containing protein 1 [Apaloderma vittatum]
MAPMIRPQAAKLLRPEKEIGHLSSLETDSKQKDVAIRELQDEVAAMAKILAQAAARNEVELTQKLLTFDQELGAKTEEIRTLKEQISDLQKGSSQIFSHSLYERDLEIRRLRKESEKLKRDQALAEGLATSLRREIGSKEQKIQQLKEDVERMKKENREKDDHLVILSAKRIRELEYDVERLQGETQKYHSEQEGIRKQLAEKAKTEKELKADCARRSLQLQEMGRRERLLKADLGRAQEQVIEKVRRMFKENQQIREREKNLREELSSKLEREKEVSANVEVFKKSLQELQLGLRISCSSNSLRGELGKLEAMCLSAPVSTLAVAVVEMTRVFLSWLEDAEQLLAGMGVDLQASGKGLLAALRRLLEDYQETTQRNRMLQEQLERVRESQEALLREHVRELEAKHEQDLVMKIKQIVLEKDKESKELLESAVAKEKDKCEQAVEEERKKIQDLESHLRSLSELALQQQVLMREEQLKTMRKENELERQKLQEEIVEYKEQNKQHSLTIVALEERLLEAKQLEKMLEEENAALVVKMEELRGDASKSASGAWLEVSPAAELHNCLRRSKEELTAAQSMLLSKDAIIAGLTKMLMETRARVSDLRGELSEEQKVELEQNLSRLKHQERELNLLQKKLSQMSSLVEEKDQALKAAAEELRQARVHCWMLKEASQDVTRELGDAPGTPAQVGETSKREPVVDLADLGAKCRGLRHEETIQRQKEGLGELRERVKMLEKRQSSAAMTKGSEPLVVRMKDLLEKIVQKTGLEKEPAPLSGTQGKGGKVSDHIPNRGLDGVTGEAASSEMVDAADVDKKMYLDVTGALGRLLKVRELMGVQSLKHLPREEREKAGLQIQKDLGLLYNKIRNLQSRLERKEEMLKDYEELMEQLRLSQASLQRCQEEISRLEDEVSREAEEKALLKEALERTQLQLNKEKRLLRTAKQHKQGAKKPFCSDKRKTKERTAEAVKTGSS